MIFPEMMLINSTSL